MFFNLLRIKCFKFDTENHSNPRARNLVLGGDLKARLTTQLLEGIPETLAKHSQYRTQLEDSIRAVMEYAGNFKYELGDYFCKVLNSEEGCRNGDNIFDYMKHLLADGYSSFSGQVAESWNNLTS